MTNPAPLFFPQSPGRQSARTALWAAHLPKVAPMMRQALALGSKRSQAVTNKALGLAILASCNGAHFLLSGDFEAYRSAISALAQLNMLGCEDLARLADTVATLIAAAQRGHRPQARICGQVVKAIWPSLLDAARGLWVMSNPAVVR